MLKRLTDFLAGWLWGGWLLALTLAVLALHGWTLSCGPGGIGVGR